jgi:hypothetical protein
MAKSQPRRIVSKNAIFLLMKLDFHGTQPHSALESYTEFVI